MQAFLKTAILAGFCAAAGLAVGMGAARAQVQKQVKPLAGGFLNVRAGPGTDHADIGDIASGSLITVLGQDETGRWAIIDWQGRIAYVARSFLTDPAPVINDGLGWFEVTGIPADDPDGGLVVRSGPGVGHSRLAVAANGTRLKIVALSPDRKWSQAQAPSGATGWVRNAYLRPVAGPATPPASPAPPAPALASSGTVVVNAPDRPTPIHAAPDDAAPVQNLLEPGSPVAVLGPADRDWLRVSVLGQVGYMRADGSVPGGGAATPEGMPLGLDCGGTEPFWSFQINTDASTGFEEMNSPGLIRRAPLSNVSDSGYPYGFRAGPISGRLGDRACSDGMSDFTYPWSLLLNLTLNGEPQSVQGCCMLQQDGG